MLLLVGLGMFFRHTSNSIKKTHVSAPSFFALSYLRDPVARFLRISFGHEFSMLRLSIPAVSFTVINPGVEIHPYHSFFRGRLRGSPCFLLLIFILAVSLIASVTGLLFFSGLFFRL